MSIITLTTDWNSDDYFIGAFKGKILSHCSSAKIVDITHKVSPFNISQAAFILRNSFYHFPPGTIHINFVNSEPSDTRLFLVVKAREHFFIGVDNGIFDLILNNEEPQAIIRIDTPEQKELKSFSAFEVFANTACAMIEGKDINALGAELQDYVRKTPLRAVIEDNTITGSVIYLDSYMNAVTNITRELFERLRQGGNFVIYVQSKHYKITRINEFYHQSPVGELLAIFNSAGLLEIAINNGNAARLLNLDVNSTVRIEFSGGKK